MSNFKTGVGTQDIILGLDTAHYSESGMDTAHNTTHYSESGGHRTRKCVQMFKLGWGHRTEFKDIGGGTPHKIKVGCWLSGWLAGWLACSMIIVSMPILAPSCKLKLARFSAKLRIQDGAECGKKYKVKKEQAQSVEDSFLRQRKILWLITILISW